MTTSSAFAGYHSYTQSARPHMHILQPSPPALALHDLRKPARWRTTGPAQTSSLANHGICANQLAGDHRICANQLAGEPPDPPPSAESVQIDRRKTDLANRL